MARIYDVEIDFGDDEEDVENKDDEFAPWGSYEDFVRDCERANPGSTGYTSEFD